MNRVRDEIRAIQLEMKQAKDTWNTDMDKVNEVINEIRYLRELLNNGPNEGAAQWAMHNGLSIYDFMKQKGLL